MILFVYSWAIGSLFKKLIESFKVNIMDNQMD
jgi:hypothetical protein